VGKGREKIRQEKQHIHRKKKSKLFYMLRYYLTRLTFTRQRGEKEIRYSLQGIKKKKEPKKRRRSLHCVLARKLAYLSLEKGEKLVNRVEIVNCFEKEVVP